MVAAAMADRNSLWLCDVASIPSSPRRYFVCAIRAGRSHPLLKAEATGRRLPMYSLPFEPNEMEEVLIVTRRMERKAARYFATFFVLLALFLLWHTVFG